MEKELKIVIVIGAFRRVPSLRASQRPPRATESSFIDNLESFFSIFEGFGNSSTLLESQHAKRNAAPLANLHVES